MTDDKSANRKCYGKGLYTGLALAGVDNPKEFMNAIKFRDIENSLSGISRKVYMAIPIGELWTRRQISAELFRQGITAQVSVVDGCLRSLVDSGVVREERDGYRRALSDKPKETRQVSAEPKAEKTALRAVPKAAPADESILGKLAQIAADLRAKGDELHAKAGEVETVALWAEDQIQKNGEGASELRKLKAMLKSIME